MLDEGDAFGINAFGIKVLVHQKKKLSINFSKANTKFCLSLHCNTGNSYLFLNGKEILSWVTMLSVNISNIAIITKNDNCHCLIQNIRKS